MDEVTGVRLCSVAESEHWEVQLRFASGRVSVVRVSSLAGAVASAAVFRRAPRLTVINGGCTEPVQASRLAGSKLRVIVGSKAG